MVGSSKENPEGSLGAEEDKMMTREEKMSWITSIEYCADCVAEELGWKVVKSVLLRHGAVSVEGLNPSQYSEVFNDLSAIEADLR